MSVGCTLKPLHTANRSEHASSGQLQANSRFARRASPEVAEQAPPGRSQQGGRTKCVAGPAQTYEGAGHLGQAWAPCALTRMTAGLTLKPMGSAWAPRTAMLMICGTMLTPGTCTRASAEAGTAHAHMTWVQQAAGKAAQLLEAGHSRRTEHARQGGLTHSGRGRAHNVLADQARRVVEEHCAASTRQHPSQPCMQAPAACPGLAPHQSSGWRP